MSQHEKCETHQYRDYEYREHYIDLQKNRERDPQKCRVRECVSEISQATPNDKAPEWTGHNGDTDASKEGPKKKIVKHS